MHANHNQSPTYQAVSRAELGCANRGLDVDKDLAGTEDYVGRARQAADGTFYIEGLAGFAWADRFAWVDRFAWTDGFAWADTHTQSVGTNEWTEQE